MYMLFVFVCVHVHVYSQCDRCWTAIVMGFNVYCAALPSGGCDSLMAGATVMFRKPAKDGNVQ